jgi:hypothetical protein
VGGYWHRINALGGGPADSKVTDAANRVQRAGGWQNMRRANVRGAAMQTGADGPVQATRWCRRSAGSACSDNERSNSMVR